MGHQETQREMSRALVLAACLACVVLAADPVQTPPFFSPGSFFPGLAAAGSMGSFFPGSFGGYPGMPPQENQTAYNPFFPQYPQYQQPPAEQPTEQPTEQLEQQPGYPYDHGYHVNGVNPFWGAPVHQPMQGQMQFPGIPPMYWWWYCVQPVWIGHQPHPACYPQQPPQGDGNVANPSSEGLDIGEAP